MKKSTQTLVGFVGNSLETIGALGLIYIVIVFALCGCGSAAPESCDRTKLHGTYLLTASEMSGGTCGEMSPAMSQIVDGVPVTSPDCWYDLEQVDETGCELATDYTCDLGGGISGHYVGLSAMADAEGNVASGTVTVTLSDEYSGLVLCVSTYNVDMVRQ